MGASDYGLIWGFPNRQSHYGFIAKLGWRDIYEIPTMRLTLKGGAASAPVPAEDSQFELDYSNLASASPLFRFARTHDYRSWRYAKHPTNRYVNRVIAEGGIVLGHCVTKTYG